jgi:hypothetical protein
MDSREVSARESPHCRNCDSVAPDQFCPHCGQETNEHLPTAREFAHEFILHYFAAEGRLWRTLGALVLHPGRLTLEYVRGRKRSYVLPLRLYLTTSVVFFLLLKLVATPAEERVTAAFQRSLHDGHTTFTIVDVGVHAIRKPDGSFDCTLPKWVCKRIDERVMKRDGELERRLANLTTELLGRASTAVFVLLPLFAFYLKLAYFKRAYGEHFLFALHVHSFWFLVLLVLLLPLPAWLGSALGVYMFLYGIVALHAVYASSWFKTALKGIAVGSAYLVSLGIATIVIGLMTFIE